MDRRLVIAALACWPAARLHASGEDPRPRHRISAATLFEALSARFPVRLGFGQLLQLQVSAPRLLLLPARNRIGATLQGQLGGLPLGAPPSGEIDLVFALRYEPGDRTLRAHDAEVLDVRWPGMAPEQAQAVQGLLPALARQVGEIVLHKLTPADLALADTMGFEPEEIRVVDEGLVVFFGPKQRR